MLNNALIDYSTVPFVQCDSPDVSKYFHIITVNDFNEMGYRQFMEDMSKAINSPQPIIPIVIDSYGGEIYSLNGMIDILRASEKPICTIVTTKAMSAGALLFSCGDKRYRFVSPSAIVMVHDPSGIAVGKSGDVQNDAKQLVDLQNWMLNVLDDNCGKKRGYFDKIIKAQGRSDLYLNASDCVKYGMATAIGIPKFIVNVDPTYTIEVPSKKS